MPKWNRRRFAPDRYPRDDFYSSDGICRALRYHASFGVGPSSCLLTPPPPLILHSSKQNAFLFSFSFFVEKRIESQHYKRSSRYGIIFRTENSRFEINTHRLSQVYHRLVLLRHQIISFLQCREFQICRELLFVYFRIFHRAN